MHLQIQLIQRGELSLDHALRQRLIGSFQSILEAEGSRWKGCHLVTRDRLLMNELLSFLSVFESHTMRNLSARLLAAPEVSLHRELLQTTLPVCHGLRNMTTSALLFPFVSSSFANLRTLSIMRRRMSSEDIHELAKAAPQLVELILFAVEPAYEGRSYLSNYMNLRTLSVQLSGGWEDILSNFHAPILETIHANQNPLLSSFDIPAQGLPVFRSVRHLDLGGTVGKGQDHDGHVFRQTPNVVTLDLFAFTRTLHLIECLEKTQENLLPMLERLIVSEVCDAPYDEYQHLLRFIQRRASGTRPLKELRMGARMRREMNPQTLETISQWVTITTDPRPEPTRESWLWPLEN